MTHEEVLQGLYDNTLVGNGPAVKELTNSGLEDGMSPESMLFEALIPALEEVGARFERGDFFVPEMLIAGRAMSGALDILRPLLAQTGAESIGTFVMGTAKGDVHDIGKNHVNLMLEGWRFEGLGMRGADDAAFAAIVERSLDALVASGRPVGFAWLVGLLDALALAGAAGFGEQLSVFRKTWLALSGVVQDLGARGPADMPLVQAGLRRFFVELPARMLARPDSRAFGTHVSNADLARLSVSGWPTSLRYWSRFLKRSLAGAG